MNVTGTIVARDAAHPAAADPGPDAPLVLGDKTAADVTRDVCAVPEGRAGTAWWGAFLLAVAALTVGVVCVWYQTKTGIGTWGLNRTVGWAFDITNFVFWVGIGHAGTLISAVLLLLRQKWRTSINRSAEAMTIFAVICAGLFPVIHMGRPWLAGWVFPYPNTRGSLWVNFRSPLLWDVFAIGTYFTISLLFWYLGLVPDLATLRDRACGLRKRIFGWFSLGFDGSARTWSRYETACVLLAALATPLVVSVHSVVSTDFATSLVPGWHTTVFPPYFVVGAVFSGFAMVLTLMLIARKVMRFEHYITPTHIGAMCKVIVFTGSVVGLAYLTELFAAWWSGNPYERFAFANRMRGPFAWAYWIMFGCNVIVPQFLWFRRVRESLEGAQGEQALRGVPEQAGGGIEDEFVDEPGPGERTAQLRARLDEHLAIAALREQPGDGGQVRLRALTGHADDLRAEARKARGPGSIVAHGEHQGRLSREELRAFRQFEPVVDHHAPGLPVAGHVAHRELGIVREDGADAGEDRAGLGAQPVHVAPRVLARDPAALAVREGDAPVERRAGLQAHPGAAPREAREKSAMVAAGLGLEQARLDADAGGPQALEAVAAHPRIGIADRGDHPRDARRDERVGAWRRAAVMAAGLEGHVHRGAGGAPAARGERHRLGVGFAGP